MFVCPSKERAPKGGRIENLEKSCSGLEKSCHDMEKRGKMLKKKIQLSELLLSVLGQRILFFLLDSDSKILHSRA